MRHLLLDELRQGALDGLMVDALARAAGLSVSDVRRAVMFAGDAAVVAEAALTAGAAGLSGYRLELFRPLRDLRAGPRPAEGASSRSGGGDRSPR